MTKKPKPVVKSASTLRFAHPFFTMTPKSERADIPGVGNGLAEYPSKALLLEPIPAPQRDPTMQLDAIIGATAAGEIEDYGTIIFHAVGDTGSPDTMTELISEAMTADYDISDPKTCPAFLLHLGDVIYYQNTNAGYLSQFYTPYKDYPGKIIAIPGNHDGEMVKYDKPGQLNTGQSTTLEAFQANFCQPTAGVPTAAAGTIYREMISQPGVYWYLNTTIVDIVGLYSNVADGPGYIADNGVIGTSQMEWFTKTLQTIAESRKTERKAFILAVHHPPFSGGGHSPSVEMLEDIDACCKTAGIMPDAVISGHSHNYQRFTRYYPFNDVNMQIPYFVVGCSGHGIQPVANADGAKNGDHTFDSSLYGYGYLTLAVNKENITIKFTQVNKDGSKQPYDKTIVVDLSTNQIVPS